MAKLHTFQMLEELVAAGPGIARKKSWSDREYARECNIARLRFEKLKAEHDRQKSFRDEYVASGSPDEFWAYGPNPYDRGCSDAIAFDRFTRTVVNRRVPLTGDTFKIRDAIKARAGQWDADKKVWMVPHIHHAALTAMMRPAT